MTPECRHIMPSGLKCHAIALRGSCYCYFHTRLHRRILQTTGLPGRPAKPNQANEAELIEIPLLEDRSAIQVVITQVLNAYLSNQIDVKRTTTLLSGIRLAAQNVDKSNWALPIDAIESLTRTRNGDELAPDNHRYGGDEYGEDDENVEEQDDNDEAPDEEGDEDEAEAGEVTCNQEVESE